MNNKPLAKYELFELLVVTVLIIIDIVSTFSNTVCISDGPCATSLGTVLQVVFVSATVLLAIVATVYTLKNNKKPNDIKLWSFFRGVMLSSLIPVLFIVFVLFLVITKV